MTVFKLFTFIIVIPTLPKEPLKTTNAKLKVLVCGIKEVLFAEKHKESEVSCLSFTFNFNFLIFNF